MEATLISDLAPVPDPRGDPGRSLEAPGRALTRRSAIPIVPAMYGFNPICGICAEIIS